MQSVSKNHNVSTHKYEEMKVTKLNELNKIIPLAFKTPEIVFDNSDYVNFMNSLWFLGLINKYQYVKKINGDLNLDKNIFQDEKLKTFIRKNFFFLLKHVLIDKTFREETKEILFSKLINLYKINYFNENDMILYIRFLIIIGNKSNENRLAFCFFNKICSVTKNVNVANRIIREILPFAKEIIIQGSEKSALLSLLINVTDYLMFERIPLEKDTQNILKDFLISLHFFQYKAQLFNVLMKSTLSHFDSFENYGDNLNFKLDFLLGLFKEEIVYIKKDELFLNNYFLFRNKQQNGIELKKFSQLDSANESKTKGFTVLFGFKPFHITSTNQNNKMMLLEICECKKDGKVTNKVLLQVYIEKDYLYIKEEKRIYLLQRKNQPITIVPNKTYLFCFSQEKAEKSSKSKVIIKLNEDEFETCEVFNYPSKPDHYSVFLGTSPLFPQENNFSGYFGSFFLFKEAFTIKIIRSIFTFKGLYDNLLLCDYKNKFLDKSILNNDYEIENLSKFKVCEKIKGMCTTLGIKEFNNTKKKFKENALDFRELKGDKYIILGKYIRPVKTRNSLFEFFHFDGLKFIQLHCEYYLQLIEYYESKDTNDKIKGEIFQLVTSSINTILSLIEFFFQYLGFRFFEDDSSYHNLMYTCIDIEDSNVGVHSNELIFLFSHITKLLLNLANFSQKTPTNSIISLLNILSTISIDETSYLNISLRNKLIYFLMNRDLYKDTLTSNNSIFNNVCLKIFDCIQSKNTGLLKISFLNLIVTHKDFIRKKNESFLKLFNGYLHECFFSSKFNICLNLFDNILSYDIKDIDIIENLTAILYENFIDFEILMKQKDINKKPIVSNIYIFSAIDYINSLFKYEQAPKDSIDLIIAYFIQIIQTFPFEDKPLIDIAYNIQILEHSFISFFLLCFDIIKVEDFKTFITSPQNLCDIMLKDDSKLHINFNNLHIKLQSLIIIINRISKDENAYKERAEKIFKMFLSRILQYFNLSKDNITLYKQMKSDGVFNILKGKKYLYNYYKNYELNENFFKDIFPYIPMFLYFNQKPFIFKLLYIMLIKSKAPNEITRQLPPQKIFSLIFENIISTINTTKTISKFPDIQINFAINRINILIFSYKLSSLFIKRTKYEGELFFFELALEIFEFETKFSRVQLCVGKLDTEIKYKYIIEIIAEIYINLFIATNKQKFLVFLENLILTQPNFNCSYFFQIETQAIYEKSFFEKKQSDIKVDKSKLKETEKKLSEFPKTKFIEVSFVIYFYLKFSLLSMQKCDVLLKKTYDKIKTILYQEIKQLKQKIKKHKFGDFEFKDHLYQKLKKYFTYDLIAKKLSKINFENNLNSQHLPINCSIETKIAQEIRDIDLLIFKKYEKEKSKGQFYSHYFNYNYDKDYKLKSEIYTLSNAQSKIHKQTFTIRAYRKHSIDKEDTKLNEKKLNNKQDEFRERCIISHSELRKKIKMDIDNIQKEENATIMTKMGNFYDIKNNSSLEKLVRIDNFFFNYFPNINSRKYFIYAVFGEYFKDKIFNNKDFIYLSREYRKKFYYSYNETFNISYLPYPTKLKNYFTKENKIRPFLKPDLKFFSNKLISISHNELDYSKCKNNLTSFKNRLNNEVNQLLALIDLEHFIFNCEFLNIEEVIYGYIKLTENYIIFYSDNENDPRIKPNSTIQDKMRIILSSLETDLSNRKKLIIIRYSQIRQIYIRRFLFKMQASEIFLKNGKSFLFNLFSEEKNREFFKDIKFQSKRDIIIIDNLKDYFLYKKYTENWQKNKISTFDYLCHVNFYASRSYNDINQYPIFPWLNCLYAYSPKEQNPVRLREFSYPLSIQTEEKRNELLNKAEKSKEKLKHHLSIHYSTAAFTIFFLFRINPFNHIMIKFQNGAFDQPNRMFHSFYDVLKVLVSFTDNRELIPEIFYLPELFINLNFNNFGVRSTDHIRIHNGKFDDFYKNIKKLNSPISNNPVEFICWYRRFLDIPIVRQNIHKWFDLLFGVNQIELKGFSNKLFWKYSYEKLMDLEEKIKKYKKKGKEEKEIYNIIRGKICCILNFGQTPKKLFDDKHPSKVVKKSKQIINTQSAENIKQKSLYQEFSNDNCDPDGKGNQILYFGYETLIDNKKIFYILTKSKACKYDFKIIQRNKKSSYKDEEFLTFSLTILRKFTLGFYDLIISQSNKIKKVYNTKYTFTSFINKNLFAFVNYFDNSIRFYSYSSLKTITTPEMQGFIMQSMATSILKIKENEFATGHENGFLIHWKINESDNTLISISKVKSVIAQTTPILFITYNDGLNIIITGDSYGYVSIRNFENFELLTVIKLSLNKMISKLIAIDCQINKFNNLLYILAFDSKRLNYVLFGYTVNGMMFSYFEDIAGSFHILKNGNIITYCYSKKGFLLSRGERLSTIISECNLDIRDKIVKFIYLEEENTIYYMKKHLKTQRMYLDKFKLNEMFRKDLDREEIFKENGNISTWENVEYEQDINDNLSDSE